MAYILDREATPCRIYNLLPFPNSPVRTELLTGRDARAKLREETTKMLAALTELERVQTQILERISKLELSHLAQNAEFLPSSSPLTNGVANIDVEARLSNILRSNSVNDFSFKRVPSDYYDWPLESRRDVVGAASVHLLCKSIVLVNTQAPSNIIDCGDRNNSKYYVAVVQYTARFNAETVKNFLYTLNDGKISKKKFDLRLAPGETSIKLTGYEHNAVTCIGMQTDIPGFNYHATVVSPIQGGFFMVFNIHPVPMCQFFFIKLEVHIFRGRLTLPNMQASVSFLFPYPLIFQP
ncbi:hypothetical protein CRYUN_Cryun13aG0134100 [Craigia yunnanensis]